MTVGDDLEQQVIIRGAHDIIDPPTLGYCRLSGNLDGLGKLATAEEQLHSRKPAENRRLEGGCGDYISG